MNKMTREEAIVYWKQRSEHIHNWLEENEDVDFIGEYVEAIDLAIESLQFVAHFDLLKEFQSLQEVVQCNNCKWKLICRQTVEQANANDIEYRPLEWCSYGKKEVK